MVKNWNRISDSEKGRTIRYWANKKTGGRCYIQKASGKYFVYGGTSVGISRRQFVTDERKRALKIAREFMKRHKGGEKRTKKNKKIGKIKENLAAGFGNLGFTKENMGKLGEVGKKLGEGGNRVVQGEMKSSPFFKNSGKRENPFLDEP